jgi:hypothetical protein
MKLDGSGASQGPNTSGTDDAGSPQARQHESMSPTSAVNPVGGQQDVEQGLQPGGVDTQGGDDAATLAPRAALRASLIALSTAGDGEQAAQGQQAFAAALAYQNHADRAAHVATATLHQSSSVALTAMTTFGLGRAAGINTAAAFAPSGSGIADVAARAAESVGLSSSEAAAVNLGGTVAVPALFGWLFPAKMTAIDPKALVPEPLGGLTDHEANLRAAVKKRQDEISRIGSPSNIAFGATFFSFAHVARFAFDSAQHPATAGPGAGASSLVSMIAGAAFGCTLAQRMASAEMLVPNASTDAREPINMKLFYPAETASVAMPNWLKSGQEFAWSFGGRMGALALAGTVLQTVASTVGALADRGAAAAVQGVGMFGAAAGYFATLQVVSDGEASLAAARVASPRDSAAVAPQPEPETPEPGQPEQGTDDSPTRLV